jgi:hypothetical protein
MKVILMLIVTGLVLGAAEKNEIKDWSSQEEMHKHYISEFEKAEDFGMRRTLIIDYNRFKTLTVDGQQYRFSSMNLISVTDRKKPVLWLTHGVPNRTTIKDKNIKKRSLSIEEKESFRQLKNGKKFLTAKQGDTLVLTGVLRAEEGCIRCHDDYSKGDLMGAFKYILTPAGLGLERTKKLQQKVLPKQQKQKDGRKLPGIS